MAMTEHRPTTSTAAPATPARTPERAPERMSARTSVPLGLAWLVLFPLAIALEPTAAQTTTALWEWAASLVLLTGLGLTAAGLGTRRPWGATASLATSLVFTAGVFACPATGHHAFGLWWFGEFGAALTLVALSAVAVVRARRLPN
jgi:hypothetical protein